MEHKQLIHLLNQMTLEEKIGQLVQLTPQFFDETNGEVTGPLSEMGMTETELFRIGSVLGTHTKEQVLNIQKTYLEKSRLKIPLVFMADVIHGYETIFPVPLALASSWSPEVVESMAQYSALEASRAGVQVTFSPMVDLVRDARWGRVMESTGEDKYLNSIYAKAFVKGYQGEVTELATHSERIAACAKHFIGYGAAEGGRDYNTVDISDLNLYQNYLPSFKAALDAGARLVMTSFNTVRGIPSTANEWLLRKVLRQDLSFDGLVISDWAAVAELISHGVAKDAKEATLKAIKAGCDMDMMTNCYQTSLKNLIESGELDEKLVDQACLQVLQLKNELGLFENPYRGLENRENWQDITEDLRQKSRELATKSMVLLKNEEQILPLSLDKKIAVVGPLATSQDVLGAWSWIGKTEEAISLGEAMLNSCSNVTVAGTEDRIFFTEMELTKMLEAAKSSDIIVLAVGESSEESGEAASKGNIRLPESHEALIHALAELNKKLVLVLFNGRPLVLTDVINKADAVLEAWFPGSEAGNAISDILTGAVAPTGKLPMSFPYAVGQVPIYYNELRTGRPCTEENQEQGYISKYLDQPNTPLFPFGYGLTYGEIVIEHVEFIHKTITKEKPLEILVTCKNVSTIPVTETIQVYVRDEAAEIALPKKELKGFKTVTLAPKEIKTINIHIEAEALAYCHSNLQYDVDAGSFLLSVGLDSNAPEIGQFIFE